MKAGTKVRLSTLEGALVQMALDTLNKNRQAAIEKLAEANAKFESSLSVIRVERGIEDGLVIDIDKDDEGFFFTVTGDNRDMSAKAGTRPARRRAARKK